MKNKRFEITSEDIMEDSREESHSEDGPFKVSKFRKEKQEFKRLAREKEKERIDYHELMKERRKQRNFKSARLIVRNISFKSNEESIKKHFSKFGEVSEVNILKKGDKLVGCCFVQYDNKANAAKAIGQLSGKLFMGRPIVVDWALPKDKFNQTIKAQVSSNEIKVEIKEEPDSVESSEPQEDPHETQKMSETSSEDGADKPSESEHSDDDEESDPSEPKEVTVKKKGLMSDIDSSSKRKKFNFQYDPQDVSDGRTVFLKNVPFSATDDDLLKCAEGAGSVVYAVICVDPLTEHSKGTAFVKFSDKSVVDNLIQGNTKLDIKGNKLEVFLALKKNQIQNMKTSKGPKDKRNLYLLREGIVLAGSPASEGVSEGDMAKRLQLEHWKTQTLRNLSKFVSNNRLVIHNIPPFINDEKLQQIFKENSPKGSIITEARIMRNIKDIDEKGVGSSKGFGFVCFTRHEHALEALRRINNNPNIFKENKRPIVGFAIENMIALREKEKRKARSMNPPKKPTVSNSENPSTSDSDNRKRKFCKVEDDNLPKFCGYTAKLGAKKMRTVKELRTQANLHHQAVLDKKREKKKKIHFGKQYKNRKNLKKKM